MTAELGGLSAIMVLVMNVWQQFRALRKTIPSPALELRAGCCMGCVEIWIDWS